MWQIDATKWELADSTPVEIINIIDDHSRVCVGSRAVPTATGVGVLETLIRAGGHWGLPAAVLSDNATYFTGKRRGWEAPFETALRAIKIKAITSTPHHPTTCGKVERFHQTLKKWLKVQDPATTLYELQALLDQFTSYYNHQRPHRAHNQTPATIHTTNPKTGPGTQPIKQPTLIRHLTVNKDGIINTTPWRIGVGVTWAGHHVTVLIQGQHAAIFSETTSYVPSPSIPPAATNPPTNPAADPNNPANPNPYCYP